MSSLASTVLMSLSRSTTGNMRMWLLSIPAALSLKTSQGLLPLIPWPKWGLKKFQVSCHL